MRHGFTPPTRFFSCPASEQFLTAYDQEHRSEARLRFGGHELSAGHIWLFGLERIGRCPSGRMGGQLQIWTIFGRSTGQKKNFMIDHWLRVLDGQLLCVQKVAPKEVDPRGSSGNLASLISSSHCTGCSRTFWRSAPWFAQDLVWYFMLFHCK